MLYNISKRDSFLWNNLFRERARFIPDLHFAVNNVDNLRFSGDMSTLTDKKTIRIAIVGTRDIDLKAKAHVAQVVSKIKECYDSNTTGCRPVIVSGLAMGVDIEAHMQALANNIPTVAVLPTGLDKIYPYAHRDIAKKLTETPECGLLTQFDDETAPAACNFIDRNATLALISDIIIVVASKKHGGAIVTAKLAHSFDVPVFAVPGEPDDVRRTGCNNLIHSGVANIIPSWDSLDDMLFV